MKIFACEKYQKMLMNYFRVYIPGQTFGVWIFKSTNHSPCDM